MEHSDKEGLLAKYGLLAVFIMIGATTQVILSNQKKKLSTWENVGIFLSCSLVGGTWALYFDGNSKMLAITGMIAAIGYNLTKGILLMVKDPESLKQIIKDRINKI
jgi:hypothetical protein